MRAVSFCFINVGRQASSPIAAPSPKVIKRTSAREASTFQARNAMEIISVFCSAKTQAKIPMRIARASMPGIVSLYHVEVGKKDSVPTDWSVYIVCCKDGSLYTGVAKDVDARIAVHNSGKGAAYTRGRRPVSLRYREDGFTRSTALKREAGIKSLTRSQKEQIITSS